MNTSKLIAIFLAVFAITSHAATYVITKSEDAYTATKDGTATVSSIWLFQNVINAIKSDANGADCTIQFGSGGSDELDIGTETITFDGSGTPTWGLITLEGKLTSASNSTSGVIIINNGASVTSNAELAATSSGYLLYHNSTGTLTISGGTVSAPVYAVYNRSSGTVNISGGTVSATGTYANAVYNYSTGKIIVSGTATVTSANGNNGSGTTGGTIYNSSTGTIEITGGTVNNAATTNNYGTTIVNRGSGTILVTGGTTGYERLWLSLHNCK